MYHSPRLKTFRCHLHRWLLDPIVWRARKFLRPALKVSSSCLNPHDQELTLDGVEIRNQSALEEAEEPVPEPEPEP